MILLSVLICAVPSRMANMAIPLFERISKQCEDGRLEVLLLLDNKRRTIGGKRNAMQSIARGQFISFIDDDDDVSYDYVQTLLAHIEANPDADLFVYDTLCSLDDKNPAQIVKSDVEFEDTEYSHETGALRKPVQTMCWRRELAQSCTFPERQWGEDKEWSNQACPKVTKQVRIEGPPLFEYRWRAWRTEAE